jgi:hypothetical protein
MRETISLLVATAILAAGGLGLYMYKSNDEKQNGGDGYDGDGYGGDSYNEDTLFGSGGFWNKENDLEDEEEEYYEPKVRARGGKTKRSRRGVGTKRRY